MEVKLFEIRDKATFIPVLAVKLCPRSEEERWLLARTGYGTSPLRQSEYVLLFKLAAGTGQATCDPYEWGDGGTMGPAHNFIQTTWHLLKSGDVVDVEHIRGESETPKRSERLDDTVAVEDAR